MLQIIDLENNELFTQVSSEESVSVSGGQSVPNAAAYSTIANLFGIELDTQRNTALLLATGALNFPGEGTVIG